MPSADRRISLRCRLGMHKPGEYEPTRNRIKRFQAYEVYCVRCDRRLS